MPEIILEISLNRSSGVLAGIVASLAQAGIELKSQKLRRATEGRGGWLTVVGSGDSPEPAVLAERLNGTRGVEKLMRVIVDGEAILAEGKPLADQIQHDDLAELSAGSDTEVVERRDTPRPASPAAPDRKAHGSVPDIEDLPILSEPEPEHPSPSVAEPEVELEPELEPEPEPEPGPELEPELEPEPEPENELELEKDSARDLEAARADTAPGIDTDPVEHALGEALGQAREALDQEEPAPEFHPQPTAEGDLAEALHVEADTEGNDEASTVDEGGKNPAQVGAVLRRRRRRRR